MSDYDTIGKTVIEYTENSRHIACLKKQLSDIGENLVTLGEQLRDDPSSVTIAPTEILVSRPNPIVPASYTTTISADELDMEHLKGILEMLGKAQDSRQQLEQTLTGMRLTELITRS